MCSHQFVNAATLITDSLVQANSIVLDGGVNRENRVVQWESPHKRIIFATPQTFKNDVCTGLRKYPYVCMHACKQLDKLWYRESLKLACNCKQECAQWRRSHASSWTSVTAPWARTMRWRPSRSCGRKGASSACWDSARRLAANGRPYRCILHVVVGHLGHFALLNKRHQHGVSAYIPFWSGPTLTGHG